MRKTSLVFLCIALCMTSILPVTAKKGGGQAPTTISIGPEDADVTYTGPAKVRDVESAFSLTIGVEGKKKTVAPVVLSENWPGEFSDLTIDVPKSFFSIYINKNGDEAQVTCSWDESYVVKAYGTYSRKINDEGKTELTITIDSPPDGRVVYYEIRKREGLVEVPPTPLPIYPITFTVTF